MCDDITNAENEAYLSRRRLGISAAATAVLIAGCGPRQTASGKPEPDQASDAEDPKPAAPEAAMGAKTLERRVTIETPDGEADGLFVAPKAGEHPGVLLWPDVAGLRPAYEEMARRLAAAGYAVLAVNPYYRSAKSPILTEFAEWRTDEGRAKIAPMREALTAEAISRDGAALVAWLDGQPEVDKAKKIGTQGYCMSGSFTFRTAAASERVGAIASFHGGGLVTDKPESPHLLFAKMQAAALICIAENDHARDPDAKGALESAAKEAGQAAEIEVYAANHGWCALDSPVYAEAEAERAWSRLLATYRAHL